MTGPLPKFGIALAFLIGCGFAAPLCAAELEQAPAGIRQILADHCLRCHSGAKAKGEVELAALAERPVDSATLPVWVQAMEVVQAGEMPPADEPPLSVESRERLIGWIEQRMAIAVQASAGDPGAVATRLTRGELDRTLAALTGTTLRASSLLPADGAGGEGFPNVGSVQPISPEVADTHLEVARFVADRLVITSGAPRFALDSCTDGEFAASRALYKLSLIRLQAWLEDMTIRLLDGASRARHGEALDQVAQSVHLPVE